eukprot:scaffold42819_cov54-Phaeocystis_antarctica.AAC.7
MEPRIACRTPMAGHLAVGREGHASHDHIWTCRSAVRVIRCSAKAELVRGSEQSEGGTRFNSVEEVCVL